jgi:hypothetical protein
MESPRFELMNTKMFIPDLEIIVGTYEEFLLGYKSVKKEDTVRWKKNFIFENVM